MYNREQPNNLLTNEPAGSRKTSSIKSGRQRTKLSLRQTAVLAQVSRGLADKEIAAVLGISEETVGWHLKRIFKLFGVHSRTALLCRWLNDVGQADSQESPLHVCGAGKNPIDL
jgi:DNA-binding CsgD family transcriptional regulator